jgi:3-hydroxyisobutyrate dehydrogenase-like beta-hydroxyacid dehydrogenase
MTAVEVGQAVGFIGLGQMGRPMARRLADWPGGLWVHDVDQDAVEALERSGAKGAATPREVAERARVVSVMVRDDEQVTDVVEGPGGVLEGAVPGACVVVHSTIRPDTAQQLAHTAAARGVHVVDAPVSGGFMGAADGRLAIMVGGTDEAFATCREALERMGEVVVHLGPAGAGTRAKLARNLIHFVAFAAVTEAQRVAEAAGIDLQALGRVVRHTDSVTGGPGAIMLRDTAASMATDDDWYPVLDHVRALGEKDLTFALELAGQVGVDAPLTRLALERLGPGLGLADDPRTPDDEGSVS